MCFSNRVNKTYFKCITGDSRPIRLWSGRVFECVFVDSADLESAFFLTLMSAEQIPDFASKIFRAAALRVNGEVFAAIEKSLRSHFKWCKYKQHSYICVI